MANKCQKIFAVFAHPTTSDLEVLAFSRNFGEKINSVEGGLRGIFEKALACNGNISKIVDDHRRTAAEVEALRSSLAQKDECLAIADEKCGRLAQENALLQARIEQLESVQTNVDRSETPVVSGRPSHDLGMDAREFLDTAKAKCGQDKCKSIIAHGLGISVSLLNAHLLTGYLPYSLAAKFSDLGVEELQPASRNRWNDDERERLTLLLEEDHSDDTLACILSAEFGRRIFEGGIARQRRKIARARRSNSVPNFRTASWKNAALH
ncbi:hypothetical protein FV232_05520 [Methylobacterium sp. WL30]|uniref:hypothetical protein n=1 Tax=unclassified Methylobacterium TaxID=2615210 RepID=UPI0011C9FC48|nr:MULTISPECIES: hypothetical protein [unclassified Methylobacterium]TXN40616.1 hypothetical protein FV225_05645 [Methylobacterium sp. WL93]TXN51554.1 hypothetical protein FV227_07160 [Methylobacterium sp. WL119]TXN69532.1 hypothetical protein FV232_05520 [Methylobacterium sp. WL30]